MFCDMLCEFVNVKKKHFQVSEFQSEVFSSFIVRDENITCNFELLSERSSSMIKTFHQIEPN